MFIKGKTKDKWCVWSKGTCTPSFAIPPTPCGMFRASSHKGATHIFILTLHAYAREHKKYKPVCGKTRTPAGPLS